MDILSPKYNAILNFLSSIRHPYRKDEILDGVPCDNDAFLYLLKTKKYIRSYMDGTYSLSGDGETYLTNYNKLVKDDLRLKYRSDRAFWIAVGGILLTIATIVLSICKVI